MPGLLGKAAADQSFSYPLPPSHTSHRLAGGLFTGLTAEALTGTPSSPTHHIRSSEHFTAAQATKAAFVHYQIDRLVPQPSIHLTLAGDTVYLSRHPPAPAVRAAPAFLWPDAERLAPLHEIPPGYTDKTQDTPDQGASRRTRMGRRWVEGQQRQEPRRRVGDPVRTQHQLRHGARHTPLPPVAPSSQAHQSTAGM